MGCLLKRWPRTDQRHTMCLPGYYQSVNGLMESATGLMVTHPLGHELS